MGKLEQRRIASVGQREYQRHCVGLERRVDLEILEHRRYLVRLGSLENRVVLDNQGYRLLLDSPYHRPRQLVLDRLDNQERQEHQFYLGHQ